MKTRTEVAVQRFAATGMRRPGSAPRSGFTLIELLVVVAIISIIAALLLSSVSSAKTQAQAISCKNHLHQMGIAVQLYVNDFQDRYPSILFSPSGQTLVSPWERALEPYYPLRWTNASYHCPGYKGLVADSLGAYTNVHSGSYAYNAWGFIPAPGADYFGLSAPADLGASKRFVNTAEVVSPAEMFEIGESRFSPTPPGVTWLYPNATTDYMATEVFNLTWQTTAQRRHGAKYNQLCCDGHVELLRPELLYRSLEVAPRWNKDNQPHKEIWP